MMRFRSKIVEIEAMQWKGTNRVQIARFILGNALPIDHPLLYPGNGVFIETPEGTMRADIGDWIIRGLNGEYYPCKPDIFWAKYEPVQ